MKKFLLWLPFSAATLCVLGYTTICCLYLTLANFYDHGEPTVVETARLMGQGKPIYHGADSAARYANVYGPNTYVIPWIGQELLGESMLAMKLPGVLLALANLGLVAATLWTKLPNRMGFWLGMVYFCGATVFFNPFYYWVRGDPQILFWASLALFGITRRNSAVAFALLGLAFAGCTNVKIHSGLSFGLLAPLIFPRLTIRNGLVFLAVAGAALWLPFLIFPEIFPLPHYLFWLFSASRRGFTYYSAVRKIIVYLALLALPVILANWRWFPSLLKAEKNKLATNCFAWFIAGFGIVIMALMASLIGAGFWHFLPVVPFLTFYFATGFDRLWSNLMNGCKTCARVLLGQASVVFLCCIGIAGGIFSGVQFWRQEHPANQLFQVAASELLQLAKGQKNHCIAMGFGEHDELAYSLTWLRPLLHSQENLLVDAPVLMEMELRGFDLPGATVDALRQGAVKVWLIPRGGEPFSLRSFYNGKPLFSERFRTVFFDCYKKTGQTQFYDIWTYQPNEGFSKLLD